jgi:hypothetical protein
MKMNKLILISALLVLGACGEADPGDVDAAVASTPRIAPPIIPPDEVANPAEPPSYEVGIATAAAVRNKSIVRCAKQPEAVRTQCEQEANAAFLQSETDLQDLRGNTE